jgi:putative inorganic carbon (HCO3(-)) transporter
LITPVVFRSLNKKKRASAYSPHDWLTLSVIVAILAITAASFGTPFTPSISQLFAKTAPTPTSAESVVMVDRLAEGGTDSGDIRRIVWKGAIDVWKRYPVFGSGVETFAYSYYQDRPMEHNTVSEWDFLYNKAHNELLNFLATTGIIGLTTYLVLQIVVAWFLFKEALFATEKNTRLLSAAILSGFVALHISNFFGFSTVMVNILMFTLPALVINQIGDDKQLHWSLFSLKGASVENTFSLSTLLRPISRFFARFSRSEDDVKQVSIAQWLVVGIASMVGLYFFIQVSMIWLADHYYSEAKDRFNNGEFSAAMKKMQLAIQLSPKEAIYYELYSKIASQYAIALLQNEDVELGSRFANSSIEASDASLRLNPVHLNLYKTRNQVLVTLALARPELYDNAIETLDAARGLSPTDAKLVYYSALVKNAKGDIQGAKNDLQRAIEMKPNYDSARFMLGQLLEEEENIDGAKMQYEYILQNISPHNEQVKAKLDGLATKSAQPSTP